MKNRVYVPYNDRTKAAYYVIARIAREIAAREEKELDAKKRKAPRV